MSGIFWLASYPKSGNTWLRAFLINLQRDAVEPVNINELDSIPNASDRVIFDNATGIESSDSTEEEIERLRPQVYEHLATEAKETLFFKIHDAYTYTFDGCPLVSNNATLGAIYLVRNPLDVVVSFAHHQGWDIDFTIATMNNPQSAFSSEIDRLSIHVRQRLLSWGSHVQSWIDAPGLRLHLVRYEDMKIAPLETFTQAARFIGLPSSQERIRRALEFSDFDEMQRQEQIHGFKERTPSATSFFRKGKIGVWRNVLTEEQAAHIINNHREVMRRLGYLTENGASVF